MTFFVVGSNGYLGRLLSASLAARWPVQRVSSAPRLPKEMKLDLLAPDTFDYESANPGDFVAFTAAISSPDICASQFSMAYAINVEGTTKAIERFVSRGARVLFLSSDAVFGERPEEVTEDAALCPMSPYGEMKSAIECRFRGEARVKALRLSYVASGNDRFTTYLRSCAAGDGVARVFDSLRRRVVAASDVAEAIEALCLGWDEFTSPVLNGAGPELVSRAEVAEVFNDVTGSNLRIDIVEPPLEFHAARPKTINMGSRYIESLLGRRPYSIREVFQRAFGTGAGAAPS
jgi:dTDP-4-dehydrorhamnose reductase